MKDDQNELFVVVDEEDNILEYRTRYDCHHDKSLIHRAVGIVVVNAKGEILLQRRSMNKDIDGGKLDVAASGHVGKGESYEEAATREMKEEIGIEADLTFVKKMIMHFSEETEYDVLFKTTHEGPFQTNKNEIDSVAFVSREELKQKESELTEFAKEALRSVGLL
jgi:isopentenyldiphosphate isomerase